MNFTASKFDWFRTSARISRSRRLETATPSPLMRIRFFRRSKTSDAPDESPRNDDQSFIRDNALVRRAISPGLIPENAARRCDGSVKIRIIQLETKRSPFHHFLLASIPDNECPDRVYCISLGRLRANLAILLYISRNSRGASGYLHASKL